MTSDDDLALAGFLLTSGQRLRLAVQDYWRNRKAPWAAPGKVVLLTGGVK